MTDRDRFEQAVARNHRESSAAPWGLHGEQARLVEAARILRHSIKLELYRSHPLGEYGVFGVARLLDALAHSLHVGDHVHHTVVSGAMEIADHVLAYLLPMVEAAYARTTERPTDRDSALVRETAEHMNTRRTQCPASPRVDGLGRNS